MKRWFPQTIVLSATLTMGFTEFVAVQQLPAEALRTRFSLPASCDPAVTALTSNASANEVRVLIECRPPAKASDSTPASGAERPASRPVRRP